MYDLRLRSFARTACTLLHACLYSEYFLQHLALRVPRGGGPQKLGSRFLIPSQTAMPVALTDAPTQLTTRRAAVGILESRSPTSACLETRHSAPKPPISAPLRVGLRPHLKVPPGSPRTAPSSPMGRKPGDSPGPSEKMWFLACPEGGGALGCFGERGSVIGGGPKQLPTLFFWGSFLYL